MPLTDRSTGVVTDASGLREHDHMCWSFEDRDEFVGRAREFLADGLRRGLRVAYVAEGSPAGIEAEMAPLGDVARLVAEGSLLLSSVGAMYPSGTVIEPEHQVEEYRLVTRAALADGFRGFRAAAEVTSLVRSAAQLDAFTRYEHQVDQLMVTEPFSALCGYDRRVLGPDGIEKLACLRPVQGGTVHRSASTPPVRGRWRWPVSSTSPPRSGSIGPWRESPPPPASTWAA